MGHLYEALVAGMHFLSTNPLLTPHTNATEHGPLVARQSIPHEHCENYTGCFWLVMVIAFCFIFVIFVIASYKLDHRITRSNWASTGWELYVILRTRLRHLPRQDEPGAEAYIKRRIGVLAERHRDGEIGLMAELRDLEAGIWREPTERNRGRWYNLLRV